MTNEEFQKAKIIESDMNQLGIALNGVYDFEECGKCRVFDMYALPNETLKRVLNVIEEDYKRKKKEFEDILNRERDTD